MTSLKHSKTTGQSCTPKYTMSSMDSLKVKSTRQNLDLLLAGIQLTKDKTRKVEKKISQIYRKFVFYKGEILVLVERNIAIKAQLQHFKENGENDKKAVAKSRLPVKCNGPQKSENGKPAVTEDGEPPKPENGGKVSADWKTMSPLHQELRTRADKSWKEFQAMKVKYDQASKMWQRAQRELKDVMDKNKDLEYQLEEKLIEVNGIPDMADNTDTADKADSADKADKKVEVAQKKLPGPVSWVIPQADNADKSDKADNADKADKEVEVAQKLPGPVSWVIPNEDIMHIPAPPTGKKPTHRRAIRLLPQTNDQVTDVSQNGSINKFPCLPAIPENTATGNGKKTLKVLHKFATMPARKVLPGIPRKK